VFSRPEHVYGAAVEGTIENVLMIPGKDDQEIVPFYRRCGAARSKAFIISSSCCSSAAAAAARLARSAASAARILTSIRRASSRSASISDGVSRVDSGAVVGGTDDDCFACFMHPDLTADPPMRKTAGRPPVRRPLARCLGTADVDYSMCGDCAALARQDGTRSDGSLWKIPKKLWAGCERRG
jgi:hypothetical protein